MVTFGYNSRVSSPLRALLFVALGVLMIVAKADAMEIVVKLFAAFILAAGIVSVFVGFRQRKDGVMPLSFFNAEITVPTFTRLPPTPMPWRCDAVNNIALPAAASASIRGALAIPTPPAGM